MTTIGRSTTALPVAPSSQPTRLRCTSYLSLAFGALLAAQGWAQSTPSPASPAANTEVEVIVLSPFVVTSSQDTGCQATNTLAGTRLNTDLKDVGAASSVYTQEFLNDINVTKIENILNIGDDKQFKPYFTGSGDTLQWTPASIVNLTSTSDTVSKGMEYEAIINPTRNWRISFSLAKNEAVKANVALEELAFGAAWRQNLETMFNGRLLNGHRSPGTIVSNDPPFGPSMITRHWRLSGLPMPCLARLLLKSANGAPISSPVMISVRASSRA